MHHAYVLEGSFDTVQTLLADFLAQHNLALSGVADTSMFHYQRMGINEARAIIERSALKPFAQSRHVLVIAAADITSEAQNALLKTFEEPAPHALFFLIVPRIGLLLPTMRSRVEMLGRAVAVPVSDEVYTFLAATPEVRMVQIGKLIEKDTDTEERDLRAITMFLETLECVLYQQGVKTTREGLHALYRARQYIMVPGAPVKILLEQFALLCPTIKA